MYGHEFGHVGDNDAFVTRTHFVEHFDKVRLLHGYVSSVHARGRLDHACDECLVRLYERSETTKYYSTKWSDAD